jgi:hypothetical protein
MYYYFVAKYIIYILWMYEYLFIMDELYMSLHADILLFLENYSQFWNISFKYIVCEKCSKWKYGIFFLW